MRTLHFSLFFFIPKKFSLKGRILFTHFGLSGPLILNTASQVADLLEEGEVTALLDVYPPLDLGALDKMILERFEPNKNRALKNAFKVVSPQGMAEAILSLVKNIDPAVKVHSLAKEDRKKLAQVLKALPLTISGTNKWLMTTIPIVIYGVMRYLRIIYDGSKAESPERVLLSDRPLLIAVTIWSLMVVIILYLFPSYR